MAQGSQAGSHGWQAGSQGLHAAGSQGLQADVAAVV
jgi:hypothetical protein